MRRREQLLPVVTLALALFAAAFTMAVQRGEADARHTVEGFGLTDVKIGGSGSEIPCPKSDGFVTTRINFTATNARGRRVNGALCSMLFGNGGVIITGEAH